MKPLKDNTKFTLANIFGSLIKNDRAISAAKTLPWWATIIVLLIATFLPVVPLMSSTANSSGDDFVSNVTYSFDRDITDLSIKLHNKNHSFVVNDNKLLEYRINDVPVTDLDDTKPIERYVNVKENQYELDIYFSNREMSGEHSINTLVNDIKKIQYKRGEGYMRPADEQGEDKNYYIPSFMVFHPRGLVVCMYKHNSIAQATTYVGDWKKTATNTDLITRTLTVEGFTIPTDLEGMTDSYKYIEGSLNNWKAIFVEGYETRKSETLLYNTLIYFAIYVGLVLFLGLLIFILTRGKRNLNRYLKWYQCIAISIWASLAPGILSLILGFIIPNYAVMFFILFEGVRVMWLTMKQLSPTQAAR